jgi:hypothetical protein
LDEGIPDVEVQPVSEAELLLPPVEQPSILEGQEATGEVAEDLEEVVEEIPASLDEIFALKPEAFDLELTDVELEDEEEEDETGKKKKKKKKKKKFVEMEYDPEKDVMIVKRVRKRGEPGWDDNWNI